MKKLNFLSSLFIASLAFVSCDRENNDVNTGNNNIGGLITVEKALIGYTIGNGNAFLYENSVTADQAGDLKVSKVYVYKSFVNTQGTADKTDDVTSNEVLFKTLDVSTENAAPVVPFSMTYPELISDLTIGGVALPASDSGLNIGDYFTLRYEQLRSDGATVKSSTNVNTKVAVGTRLAGSYKCISASYWRIGVFTAGTSSWPAETIIESVDGNTYKVVRRFGYFPPTATDDNSWLFDVNGTVISYPDAASETGNDQPFITCDSDPTEFAATANNCGTSNYVVLDNVSGKDRLYMTFGYLSPSGARIFTQVLEKQ
jgi:hypothetical protein